jgi:hypothetical protein
MKNVKISHLYVKIELWKQTYRIVRDKNKNETFFLGKERGAEPIPAILRSMEN